MALRITFLFVGLAASWSANGVAAEPATVHSTDVAPVWSGHPVGFALLTHGQRQYVAFYDAERRMTIAARTVGENQWEFASLPSQLGWDSHNYVTMAIDSAGQIHVSGNMHCHPLVYFRTERPGDIQSFQQHRKMIGRNEDRCTYPRFLTGPKGELIFTYRDGRSGNGDQYCVVYDVPTSTWRRLIDSPLFAGGGRMNAYFVGPEQDRAGTFHICWVWRNTPDCATNHDLCYAKSADLAHWETSDGRSLKLPITLADAEIVDPIPPGGGLLNGNTKIGFDGNQRPVLAYHKFDANGKTQIFNARREADRWRIYQTSDWDYRWEFQGGGTIRSEIGLGPIVAVADGTLTQTYSHPTAGSGAWILDPNTLKPRGKSRGQKGMPTDFGKVESTFPGMSVRSAADLCLQRDGTTRYLLHWETLPANRDRPRAEPLPGPSMLKLFEIR